MEIASKIIYIQQDSAIKSGVGFTLIELLVVVAIIGLLASVVLVGLDQARISARDAKRKADARVLVHALDLYYQDNSIYPADNTPGSPVYINDSFLKQFSGFPSYLTGSIPNDPSCPPSGACTSNYQYIVTSPTQQDYGLYIKFEKIPPCKFMSAGGSAAWFSAAPVCLY